MVHCVRVILHVGLRTFQLSHCCNISTSAKEVMQCSVFVCLLACMSCLSVW